MSKTNKGNTGKRKYNNGIKIIFLGENDEIPEGFVLGGLKLTEEQLEQRKAKTKETLSKLSEEEKRQRYENKSIAMKEAWAKVSQEDRHKLAMKIVENGGGWNKKTIQNTVKEKYGVENISQLQEVKDIKKETLKEISQERWGVDNPLQAKENREKAKQVIKERYGVDNIGGSDVVKSKKRETCIKRYGRPYGFNFDKCRETSMKKYGVPYNCLLPQCNETIGAKGMMTKPNNDFARLLEENGIEYTREYVIGKKAYDFKIGSILIEINPFATHNSTWGLYNKEKGIDRKYHYLKSILAKENGYRCIHIFDWEDENKIVKLLQKRDKLNARDCVIKDVSLEQSENYLSEYHLQGYAKDKIRLGLFLDDELVSIMTFGKPRYNKKYEYELVRYCAHKYVVGGAEKLFKYFLETYHPNSIISYCDFSKFNGDLYENLGFILENNNICKHWYHPKTKEHYTDAYINKLGFDRIFGTNYGKGTSNKELMLDRGFLEIYDAGQQTYIYKNK